MQRRQGRSQTQIGLASELLWRAAALSVSVSRHLVSTSVQFGQSATGKTESHQWLLVAHLSGSQVTSRARSHARAVRHRMFAPNASFLSGRDGAVRALGFSGFRQNAAQATPNSSSAARSGPERVTRTNLEYIAEIGVPDANSAHCHRRNFSRGSTRATPQTRPNAHYHLAVQ